MFYNQTTSKHTKWMIHKPKIPNKKLSWFYERKFQLKCTKNIVQNYKMFNVNIKSFTKK